MATYPSHWALSLGAIMHEAKFLASERPVHTQSANFGQFSLVGIADFGPLRHTTEHHQPLYTLCPPNICV